MNAEEFYLMKKALVAIEYLASQEKPDVRLIYRAAHVAVCTEEHPKWKTWLENLYTMMLAHGRVVKGWND